MLHTTSIIQPNIIPFFMVSVSPCFMQNHEDKLKKKQRKKKTQLQKACYFPREFLAFRASFSAWTSGLYLGICIFHNHMHLDHLLLCWTIYWPAMILVLIWHFICELVETSPTHASPLITLYKWTLYSIRVYIWIDVGCWSMMSFFFPP